MIELVCQDCSRTYTRSRRWKRADGVFRCNPCANFRKKEKRREADRQCERQRRLNNPDFVRSQDRKSKQKRYEDIKKSRKIRYFTDNDFRLKILLRTRVNRALKNNQKAGSAVRDLGCSIEELKLHLEKQFQPEMTWENQGQWHIDHIIPLCFFDLTNREQFLKACHYTNLQPLWAFDNLVKSSRHE